MNFFDRLKAQVNMNDGGKTFSNPEPLRGPVQQGPGLRQVGGTQDASQMPSGMKLGTFRPQQPIQQFEDGSSLVGQRGGQRIAVQPGQGSYGYQPDSPFGQQSIGDVR